MADAFAKRAIIADPVCCRHRTDCGGEGPYATIVSAKDGGNEHRVAIDHYENFPVASRLVPARLRPAVVAIYRFARAADDLADEGDDPPAARLAALA